MPDSPRKALRKTIAQTSELHERLAGRGPGEARDMRDLARTAPLGKDDARAHVWGMAPAGGPASVEDVKAGLVDKADVITVIEPAQTAKAKAAAGLGDPGGPGGRVLGSKPAPEGAEEEAATALSLSIRSAEIPAPKGNWNVLKSGASSFGSAGDAMRLIGADWSDGRIGLSHGEFTGAGVNVVIIDVGCTLSYLRELHPGLNWGGGFVTRDPSVADPGEYFEVEGKPGDWHGNMIARNVLRLAPEARIWDAPLLPRRVAEVGAFTEDAELLYLAIEEHVAASAYADEPWILVNAWAVADTIQEWDAGVPADARYSDGPNHPFNALVSRMTGRFDIIFAAGNFGAFAPDISAGLYDRGNGRSIKGANALPGLCTVGAVTTNGEWIGSASHGYGPAALAGGQPNEKPDLAAPSWFDEAFDPGLLNTGTSAASAVVAGVLAGMRTVHRTESPAEMIAMLKGRAAQPTQDGWNGRTGHGILQVPAPELMV